MTTLSEKFANQTDQSVDTQTQTDEDQTGLMFIGEGKKYANEAEADKAIAFKEDHISKIELENAGLRADAAKAKTIDDVLNRIQDQQTQVQDSFTATGNDDHQNQDIDALVAKALDERLTAHSAQATAEKNSQMVVDELSKRYGEKAGEMYEMKAQELDLDLDSLAAASPKAVLEFFKEPNRTVGSYMEGTTNTYQLSSQDSNYGTYDYWNKQLKSGKMKRDKVFAEQHKSLQAMGPDKFYGKTQ